MVSLIDSGPVDEDGMLDARSLATTTALRVLVICYEYPPAGGGGGRVAESVARGLARRGHIVRVLTSHVRGLAFEEERSGVSIRRAFAARRRFDRCAIPEMAAYAVAHAGPGIAELHRFRPNVVHVHFAVPSGLVAWFATRFFRVPYVLTAHLGDVPGGVPEQTDRIFRFVKGATGLIWRHAAALTAVAPHVGRLAAAAYGLSPEIIRNGIDMKNRPTPVARLAAEPVRLIWCGRMQAQKNLLPIIEGLAAIADAGWTLEVVGDGVERLKAESRAATLGVAGQIRFHGWLPEPEVERLMNASDVLLLPSLSEGLSLVTIEALRAGLAFIASRIPGVEDVVSDRENGILCDPHRPETFADGLAALIRDRDRLWRMRCASVDRRALYDEERMIDSYEAVLSRVASEERL